MPRKTRKAVRPKSKRRVRTRASTLRNDTIPRSVLGKEAQRQIDKFGLSREVAAAVVGDAATQLSRLMRGHFGDFSADRLVRFLNRLGSDVTIVIRHRSRLGGRGRVRIKAS
jgi:predicted XRE-type DNA-binding protein